MVQKTPKYNITFLDNSGEVSTTSVCLPAITAATFNNVIDPVDKWPAALKLAITNCSLCNDIKHQITLDPQVTTGVIPDDSYAQREMALAVQYQDNVTHDRFTLSIPGVNWDALGDKGSDNVNKLAPSWIALKAALETYAVSPDGNPITVLHGRRAGRRN